MEDRPQQLVELAAAGHEEGQVCLEPKPQLRLGQRILGVDHGDGDSPVAASVQWQRAVTAAPILAKVSGEIRVEQRGGGKAREPEAFRGEIGEDLILDEALLHEDASGGEPGPHPEPPRVLRGGPVEQPPLEQGGEQAAHHGRTRRWAEKGWPPSFCRASILRMAGTVLLDKEEVRSILSLYHLEDLEDFGGRVGAFSPASYWVKAGGRRYDLRITERKTLDDMVFEKDLLLHLRRAGLPVPTLVRNVARGTFTPWARRGRYVSLFEHTPGRALGRFEIRARHTRTIGRVLGELHRATTGFRRRRSNPWSLSALTERQGRLERALAKRRLPRRLEPVVAGLGEEISRQVERIPQQLLPMGPIHGGLGLERVRYQRDGLSGLVDFETACRDRFVLDLALAVSAWCWEASPRQSGGPAGRFRLTKVRAMLDGYQRGRELSSAERAALPDELRLVAARFAVERLVDHELGRRSKDGSVPYEDFRHHTARLDALGSGRAEELVRRGLEV